jgi:hypothetical protein
MWTIEQLKQLAPDVFAKLGMPSLAYIKPILVEGNPAFEVHAADGTQIALMADRDVAEAACRQNEMEPVSVH